MFDRDRLIAFLNQTESQHDAEALLAIRKSNELLRNVGAKWIDVVESAAPPESSSEPTRWEYHDPIAETEDIRREWLRRESRKRLTKILGRLGLVGLLCGTLIAGASTSNTVKASIKRVYEATRADIQLMLRTVP